MNKFFEAVANVFRIPDLRNRVLFTLGREHIIPRRFGDTHRRLHTPAVATAIAPACPDWIARTTRGSASAFT